MTARGRAASRPTIVTTAALVAIVALTSPLVAGPAYANPIPAAASAPAAWRARIGSDATHPMYGMMTVRVPRSGAGSVELGLIRLPASARASIAFVRGSCARQGSTIASVLATSTSSTGGVVRTLTLAASRTSSLRSALARTSVVARVTAGQLRACGSLSPLVEPSGLLSRQGTELILGGEPFHELSVNKYDLLQSFTVTPTPRGRRRSDASSSRASTRRSTPATDTASAWSRASSGRSRRSGGSADRACARR